MVELACGSRSMRSVFLSRFASAAARLIADRKSTRLNSSHGYISYAVFCLKKKTFRFLKNAVIGLAIALVALLLFGYFFFMRHVDAPKAWSAADRELPVGMLTYGEKVERKA